MAQTTSDARAGNDVVKTVHETDDWALVVCDDGRVEALETADGRTKRWTTGDWAEAPSAVSYRYGKRIEGIIARYAHETRHERAPEEHGAALRSGIVEGLQCESVDADCKHCGEDATHVRVVTAPNNAETSLACDDHAQAGTYVTYYEMAE